MKSLKQTMECHLAGGRSWRFALRAFCCALRAKVGSQTNPELSHPLTMTRDGHVVFVAVFALGLMALAEAQSQDCAAYQCADQW